MMSYTIDLLAPKKNSRTSIIDSRTTQVVLESYIRKIISYRALSRKISFSFENAALSINVLENSLKLCRDLLGIKMKDV